MLCQLRVLSSFNYTPFTLSLWDVSLFSQDYCSIDSAFGVSFLPSYQPLESHHLVGSQKLQGVMMVTSTILCHCVHTSSVVTSTYMIPCSIVRLCSGVLLLSKQHWLFSFVICILILSGICSCHRCECVCWDNSRWWRRYCRHHCCHCTKGQEEERGRRQWAKPYPAVRADMRMHMHMHTHTHMHAHTHAHTHTLCVHIHTNKFRY